ncbi:MAG TPA: metal-sensitive transcriptional regulator [Dehalococcoidia bacterium]|nr:metal-sensitive transcriptional regulator [Dehalococcoidia bacterium]
MAPSKATNDSCSLHSAGDNLGTGISDATPPWWGLGVKRCRRLEERVRKQVVRRLNYVSGHVAGIKKMTEADRYCVDILKQSYAVRKSLEKVEALILKSHLQTCVVEGMNSGNGQQVIDELLDLYSQANR